MIRLINADALKTALYYDVSKGTYGEFMDGSEVSFTDREILKLIDQQPTIEAIPISLIEKKIESIRQYLQEHEGEEFTSGLISKAIAYERLIEYWREENETD